MNGRISTYISRKKDLKKRCYKIIYSLHITTSWVAYCPYIQYPLQGSLGRLEAIERDMWIRSGYINGYLVPNSLIQPSRASDKRLLDTIYKLFPLPLQGVYPPVAVRRQIAEKHLPRHGSQFVRYAIPRNRTQFVQINCRGLKNAFEFVDPFDSGVKSLNFSLSMGVRR